MKTQLKIFSANFCRFIWTVVHMNFESKNKEEI